VSRTRPALAVALLLAVLSAACVRSDPVPAAAPPLAGLVPCDGGPFVAFIGGFREGEDPGSSSAYDVSYVYGLRPDLTVERITPEPGSWWFAVAPDASQVFIGRDDGSVRPGPEVQRFALDPVDAVGTVLAQGDARGLAVSPDGSLVAVTVFDEGSPVIRLLDARDGRETGSIELPGWTGVVDVVWNPSGGSLALLGTRDEDFRAVGIVPSDGGAVLPVQVEGVDSGSLVWSPDGSRLLLGGDELVEVDGTTGEVADVFTRLPLLTTGTAYASRDGGMLLSVRTTGAPWRLELRERVGDRLELRAVSVLPSDFAGAGRLVVPACALPD
jgi:hypothetical protein